MNILDKISESLQNGSVDGLTSSPPVPIVTNEDSLKELTPKLFFVLRNDSFGTRPARPSQGCTIGTHPTRTLRLSAD